MNTARLILVPLIALLSIGGVSAQTLVDQTFFLTFVPNIQFAPLYVAIEKGYFAAEGINVLIEHGDEPLGVDLIAANQRQFGMISGEQVITARANGRPVVFVYEWFQAYPVGIVAPVENGISTMEDLRGRVVGIPGRFGASYSGLTALLAANNMTEQDIQLEEIGFNAPEAVCVGRVEAAVVYSNNEPLQIQNRADAGDCGTVTGVTVIPVSASADMVSNGIVTNEETIANNPDLVTAVVRAFDHGLRDTINNPAEAYLISTNYVENLSMSDDLRLGLDSVQNDQAEWLAAHPDATRDDIAQRRSDGLAILTGESSADELIQYAILLETIGYWDADELGMSTLDSWQVTQTTLMSMGYLSEPLDLDSAFTNVFLPENP